MTAATGPFSWLKWSLGLGKKCHSRHPWLNAVDVNPDHIAQVVIVKSSHCKVSLFLLPFHIVFFGRKSHSPQLRWVCSTLLQATVAMHMIWNSSAWEIFFYFILWVVIQYHFIFVIQIIPDLCWSQQPVDSCVSLACSWYFYFLLLFFFLWKIAYYFFWHYKCSRLIL